MEQDAEELFTRYGDMIYRIAMSYGNSAQFAEDMVQEVFVRYLKKDPRLKPVNMKRHGLFVWR